MQTLQSTMIGATREIDSAREIVAAADPTLLEKLSPALKQREVGATAVRRDPALTVEPGSGQSFRDCNDGCPEMVVVPAGEFTMGSIDGEANEKPVRKMAIAKPFAVDKFEVTFAEWDVCVSEKRCKHRPDDRGWGRGNRPVIYVSWHDVMT